MGEHCAFCLRAPRERFVTQAFAWDLPQRIDKFAEEGFL